MRVDNFSPEVKNKCNQVTCSSGWRRKLLAYFNAKNEVDELDLARSCSGRTGKS